MQEQRETRELFSRIRISPDPYFPEFASNVIS